MALDIEAVHESNLAAGGMPSVGPVASLQQHGAKQADLDHLAHHAVDFHPVAYSDSVATHQQEPAHKSHDEIFQRDCESSAGKAENGGHLVRNAERDEQNQECSQGLHGEANDPPQRVETCALDRKSDKEVIH